MHRIYTVGHSNHEIEEFIALLKLHGITALCDIRSSPYSKYAPQFNSESVKQHLREARIHYVYLGKELGPRSDDPACYVEGKVQYDLLAQSDAFKEGLERLKKGAETFTLAIMCSEKDPALCHRALLVGRHLKRMGFEIRHILEDGGIEDNRQMERRLMKLMKIPEQSLFESLEELVERAYDAQGRKIAYSLKNKDPEEMENEAP